MDLSLKTKRAMEGTMYEPIFYFDIWFGELKGDLARNRILVTLRRLRLDDKVDCCLYECYI